MVNAGYHLGNFRPLGSIGVQIVLGTELTVLQRIYEVAQNVPTSACRRNVRTLAGVASPMTDGGANQRLIERRHQSASRSSHIGELISNSQPLSAPVQKSP
jgi:hypothetical protein